MSIDETTRLEDALRRALREDAAAVRPPDRLDDILRDAHRPAPLVDGDPTDHGAGRAVRPTAWRTWLAAAAAAAVVVGGVTVGSVLVDRGKPPVPGRAVTSPTVPLPSLTRPTLPTTPRTTTPSTPTSEVSRPSVAQLRAALPVYVVGHEVGSTGREVLVREFVPPSSTPLSVGERVDQAVFASTGENKGGGYGPMPIEVAGVDTTAVGPQGITVTITVSTGPVDLSPRQVAALVYTAQAAAGIGDVPVTLRFDDPAGRELTPATTRAPLTRASFPRDVLASIWVDTPIDAQLFRTGASPTVTGQASVFEAALTWELRRARGVYRPGSDVVASGMTSADAAAPERAGYRIRVGALQTGTYTLTVTAGSAKDQSVAADRAVTFYVGIVPGG